MLRQLDQNLWVAEQPLTYLGLEVGTRMTAVRLSNQKLAVISPIEMTAELKQQLDGIGSIEHIIAPNLYHYLYAGDCKSLYPNATLWGTVGLKEKQPGLAIDRLIQPDDNDLWKDLSGFFFEGFKTLGSNGFEALNEWVFLHQASRTLILTDAAFHYDSSFPWAKQLIARVIGCYDALTPSLLEKVAIRDKQTLQTSVDAVLQWDFDRVVMAHGSVIEQGGKERFRQGYGKFLGNLKV
ncbi:MAG: DUF4336 domain-containing protein [Cyanobacteria bacterium J06621_11]